MIMLFLLNCCLTTFILIFLNKILEFFRLHNFFSEREVLFSILHVAINRGCHYKRFRLNKSRTCELHVDYFIVGKHIVVLELFFHVKSDLSRFKRVIFEFSHPFWLTCENHTSYVECGKCNLLHFV